MKNLLALLLSLTLLLTLLPGCTQGENAPPPDEPDQSAASEPVAVRVMALKGPTAMGMVQLMDASDRGDLPGYTFTLAASADEVTPQLVKGEVDIAALPANLSSVLYHNTQGEIQVLAINTLGVLYLLERGESVSSAEDLRGRTIYASGKGATPEYALRQVLTQSGLDPDTDVDIQWKSEHTECLAALLSEENAVAMLPQPFAAAAQLKNPEVRTALDLNALWEEQGSDPPSALITGVVVVRRSFAQEHPEAVSAFLDSYQQSVAYVNTNTAQAAQLIEHYNIVTAQVAEQALPACNIVCIEGAEMKPLLSGYLAVLLEQNPKAVGGDLPGEDFYYAR